MANTEITKMTTGLQKDFGNCSGCSMRRDILSAHTPQPIYLTITHLDYKDKAPASQFCFLCSLDELETRKRFIIQQQSETEKKHYWNISKEERKR